MIQRAVKAHLGIPYGERADPSDRFSALVDPTTSVPGAPAAFPQRPGALDWLLGPALAELPQHEDAFQLNIYAPDGASGLPVLFYIPGGAFISGAGTVRWYDGTRLAEEGKCVVVTVNYRLGMLSHAGRIGDGNLGVSDLLQALRWVNRNIAGYGGDPGRLTLVGQSAGAFYAFLLSQMEETRGMVARTALMSLAFQPPLGAAEVSERQALVAEALGGLKPSEIDLGTLLDVQGRIGQAYAGRGLGIMPSAGSVVPSDLFDVVAAAGRLHVDELLLTHTANEAAAFLGRAPEEAFPPAAVAGFLAANFEDPASVADALAAASAADSPKSQLICAMSLHQFGSYAAELSQSVARAGTRVASVRFGFTAQDHRMGAAHGFDVPFLFGNRVDWFDAPMLQGVAAEEFESVGGRLRSMVLDFVNSGWSAGVLAGGVLPLDVAVPQGYLLDAAGVRAAPLENRFATIRSPRRQPPHG